MPDPRPTAPLRIAYVANTVLPSRAANSVQIVHMCEAFADAGASVVLFATVDRADPLEAYGVRTTYPVFPIQARPRNRRRLRSWSAGVMKAVRRAGKFDVVYTRSPYLAGTFAREPLQLALELHQPLPSDPRLSSRGWLRPHARLRPHPTRLQNLSLVVSISESLRAATIAAHPNLEKTRAIVEPDAARPVVAKSTTTARPPGPPRVGYVGSLLPGKGAEMIRTLAEALPELDFHVVGGGSEDVSRLSAHGPANVEYHGFLPHVKAADMLASFDIALAPYFRRVMTSGGANIAQWMSPLKLFEYMAHRLPIVASDLPSIREVLTHDRTALLVEPENTEAWTAAIAKLADDAHLRDRIAESAHTVFLDRHTWSQRACRILAELAHTRPDGSGPR